MPLVIWRGKIQWKMPRQSRFGIFQGKRRTCIQEARKREGMHLEGVQIHSLGRRWPPLTSKEESCEKERARTKQKKGFLGFLEGVLGTRSLGLAGRRYRLASLSHGVFFSNSSDICDL
ncbi:hypothetical protein KP509_17G081800 [Ceratopteris richardii]|uniref:Uncharacterized protein n=1 Tax=Ceratopteris richardii TaxID=49495 RepID=A0A8T2T056_CERRI|nr:hypothetical protein KP509_17G081800 [Ceratopteris richardii]